jgi:hypothetical protein
MAFSICLQNKTRSFEDETYEGWYFVNTNEISVDVTFNGNEVKVDLKNPDDMYDKWMKQSTNIQSLVFRS